MYIVSVIPISNIPRQDVLTYFSKDDILLGSLVLAPYGRQKVECLVISCVSVRSQKSEIKKEIYQLKKIERVLRETAIESTFTEGLFSYAEDFFVPVSKIFYDIYPKWYWEEDYTIGPKKSKTLTGSYFIEAHEDERLKQYEAHMQDSNTTWICLPTVALAKKYETQLKNSPVTVSLFHSKMAIPKQKKQLTSILQSREKQIIISTPFYLGVFLPLADTIIIDQAGHNAYKMSTHSYDAKMLLTYLNHTKKTLVYGDEVLPLALTKEHNHNQSAPNYPLYTKEKVRHNELFIHPVMEARFEEDLKQKKKVLLISLHEDGNQKIVCNDCKVPVLCSTCNSDLTLVSGKGVSSFLCKFCSKKTSANRKCSNCSSWNLQALGINTETIQKYVEKKYPGKKSESISVKTLALLESESERDFDAIYIVSLDTLMYSPEYASEEKLYRVLKKIETYGKQVSIQTSFPSPNILNTFKTQSYQDWVSGEYKKRQKYRFPPFGVCYSIRAKNKKGLSTIGVITQAVEKKGIRHTTSPTTLSIYIEETYERPIDLYLRKKATDDITLSKERSFF